MTESKHRKHQRRVQISIVLPAFVDLVVGTDDENPDAHSSWEILSVGSIRCEATQRVIEENMHDCDYEALATSAASVKDAP